LQRATQIFRNCHSNFLATHAIFKFIWLLVAKVIEMKASNLEYRKPAKAN